jgi:hypothetical protein
MDPPKTYTTDSFKDIKHKDTRLIRLLVLENYDCYVQQEPDRARILGLQF